MSRTKKTLLAGALVVLLGFVTILVLSDLRRHDGPIFCAPAEC